MFSAQHHQTSSQQLCPSTFVQQQDISSAYDGSSWDCAYPIQASSPLSSFGRRPSKNVTFTELPPSSRRALSDNSRCVAPSNRPEGHRPLIDFVPSYRKPQSQSPESMATLSEERNYKDMRDVMDTAKGGLGGWFSGSTMKHVDPFSPGDVPLVLVTPSSDTSSIRPSPQLSLTKTIAPTSPAVVPGTGLFGSFFSKSTAVKPLPADDLLNLSITAALFPNGTSADENAISPAAFKSLQATAEALLKQMQEAYRLRTLEVRDAKAEVSATKDECEEARARAERLKIQLEGMSQKAAQHDEEMSELRSQLRAERDLRDAQARTYQQLVSSPDLNHNSGTARPGHHRSQSVLSDMSQYYEESVADSVFSRSLSPTPTERSSISSSSPVLDKGEGRLSSLSSAAEPKSRSASQHTPQLLRPSALPNIFSKAETKVRQQPAHHQQQQVLTGCDRCREENSDGAWRTVEFLRSENRQLKDRVVNLDLAVSDALDLVSGLGLHGR